jgi:hypothetical protein
MDIYLMLNLVVHKVTAILQKVKMSPSALHQFKLLNQ